MTDLGFFIALWTVPYDMWMENFIHDSAPLLHNVALRQQQNILGGERGSKHFLSIKCFQINKTKICGIYIYREREREILSQGEESHGKDFWINALEDGFIIKEGRARRGKSLSGRSGAVNALFLLSRCSESVLCSSGAGRLVIRHL